MKRHFLLIGAFVSQFLKARMSYRFDFFVSLMASFISTLVGFLFLFVLFSKIPHLDQWSYHEVLFIYGFSLVPVGLFSLVSANLWSFGSKFVIEGNFDRVLLRPLHSLYQILCESLRIESLEDVLMGSALMIYSGHRLGLSFGPLEIFYFILLALSGCVILIAFFSMIASVNFWIEDRVGIEAPFFNMISLSKYPLTVYSTFLKIILTTVIPFGYIAFFPATLFLHRTQYLPYVIATPLVAILYALLASWVWSQGERRYGSTGT